MKLIDSSAWIEYYKPKGNANLADLVTEAIQLDIAAINGVILVEIAGFAKKMEREKIESDFSGLHTLSLSETVFEQAVSICSSLRPKGITVPATDAIIAASAMAVGASVIHLDAHFELIARHFNLMTETSAA